MSESWKRLWLDGLTSSAAVTATAALGSQVEGRSVWRPINAVSHIVWGGMLPNEENRHSATPVRAFF